MNGKEVPNFRDRTLILKTNIYPRLPPKILRDYNLYQTVKIRNINKYKLRPQIKKNPKKKRPEQCAIQ